ncbi:MFS transporter [Streptomyces sp. NPDC047737]|uniref:MFS transporter n=1 Tax=Streptomyces sp. NPDC047737 TaxID=3155740 RepID=UPI0033F38E4E
MRPPCRWSPGTTTNRPPWPRPASSRGGDDRAGRTARAVERLGSECGRRRLFIIGLVIFTVASVLVGAAWDVPSMILARALQGVGGAIIAPTSLALLTATFEEGRERSRAIALYAATAGIGASAGLVIGGAAVELISWRAGFFLNLPIGAAMLVLAARFVHELPRAPGKFDVLGAVTSTLGTTLLTYGIIESGTAGWGSTTTILLLVLGVVLLAAFVLCEWRAAQPILPLRLFASGVRSGSYAVRLLFMGSFMGFFYFTTQFFQGVLGWNALQAGLGFLPMTVVNFAVAMSVTPIVRRIGAFTTLALGIASTLAGMAWLSAVHADTSFVVGMAIPMAFIGIGQGLALAPMTDYSIHGVTGEDAGAASGLVNMAQQLGLSIGLAVLVSLTAGVGTGLAPADRIAEVTRMGLTGAAGMLVIALVVVFAVILPGTVAARRGAGRRRAASTGETIPGTADSSVSVG